METQRPSNSPRPAPEFVKGQRVAIEQATQRVRSWAVQNEMRGILGRVSADAAGTILNLVNPK